ncbi:MAG: cell division protein FtsQ/DivIB [Legionellaceae bacterium]|nr:cell division protein FtsQ/DivIB [Legionellaceae bacterium]
MTALFRLPRTAKGRFLSKLSALVGIAILLSARSVWLFLADPQRFPINTVHVEANYQHLSHQQLKKLLSPYLNYSFFSIPASRLRHELLALGWVEQVEIERQWPDHLLLTIREKTPFAQWNQQLMTSEGHCFQVDDLENWPQLPHLYGPAGSALKVLAQYKNLSKILSEYRLSASIVSLHENGAWDLILNNQLLIHLGKQQIEKKLRRFMRAWPVLESSHHSVPHSVDLRYPQGMAVDWSSAAGALTTT